MSEKDYKEELLKKEREHQEKLRKEKFAKTAMPGEGLPFLN